MTSEKSTTPSNGNNLTRWQAIRIKRTRPIDWIHLAVILFLGVLAVWTGQMMGHHMTPQGAIETSRSLDDLQMPRQLPDMPVVREDGLKISFWTLASKKRNIVNVYAPWCPACQKELPVLSGSLSETGNLIVLISQKQDVGEVKEQLDNLGLTHVHFYRDITGQILQQGKVTKLPTTFLLKDYGRVLDRLVGFSEYRLERLIDKAKGQLLEGQ